MYPDVFSIVVRQILEHLDLWERKSSRDPPNQNSSPENNDLVCEAFYEDWSDYEKTCIMEIFEHVRMALMNQRKSS